MSRRLYLIVASSLVLLFLTISPVNAAPALNLGNHANYNLTGFIQANQACTADPALYTPQACGFVSPPPPSQTFRVSWVDNGVCPPNNTTACYFSPGFLGIPTGSSVQWVHSGSLPHTATSSATLNPGLPSFNSGTVFPGSTFTNNFSVPGTYHYYCAIHPWMKGVIDVSGPPPPPPPPPPPTSTSFRADLNGNVAWTIIGLSTDVANLKVDHNVAVSISPLPGVTFTPLVEKGGFEQTITLATRVETPGTATSIILNLLRSLSRVSTAPIYWTRTAQIYTGPVPVASSPDSTFIVQPVATSTFPSAIETLLPDNRDPVFTMWWVNGPLSLGSPVQILTGSSSVTGDENLDLGTTIGTRAGWLVTSQFSQSANVTTPPPGGSMSSASFALSLVWSFDKKGDLLLRSSADVLVAAVSINSESVVTGNPCAPSGWCPTFAQVSVTRTMTAHLNLALRLASTDLNLNARMRDLSAQSSFLEVMASLPWVPFGAVGAVAAGVVGASIWYAQRARRKTIETGAVPPLPG